MTVRVPAGLFPRPRAAHGEERRRHGRLGLRRQALPAYAFAPAADGDMRSVQDHLWRFCLTALGNPA
ncbi:hypothetical protein [Nocardia sp. BMG51109]|uniref:hypothetical protein n=1 Tax=Nocardia sp. BMG51109 TaxID=1056816 RepID=UPI0004B598A9|nr:hypothetical protein [Nocardia sp. BMG51109]